MKTNILYLCIGILFPFLLTSQTISLNAAGDTIVTYPDNSWRYFETADSIFQKNIPRTSGPLAPEIDEITQPKNRISYKKDARFDRQAIDWWKKESLRSLSDTIIIALLKKIEKASVRTNCTFRIPRGSSHRHPKSSG